MKKRNDASHVMICVGKPQGMHRLVTGQPSMSVFPSIV